MFAEDKVKHDAIDTVLCFVYWCNIISHMIPRSLILKNLLISTRMLHSWIISDCGTKRKLLDWRCYSRPANSHFRKSGFSITFQACCVVNTIIVK